MDVVCVRLLQIKRQIIMRLKGQDDEDNQTMEDIAAQLEVRRDAYVRVSNTCALAIYYVFFCDFPQAFLRM